MRSCKRKANVVQAEPSESGAGVAAENHCKRDAILPRGMSWISKRHPNAPKCSQCAPQLQKTDTLKVHKALLPDKGHCPFPRFQRILGAPGAAGCRAQPCRRSSPCRRKVGCTRMCRGWGSRFKFTY